MDARGVAPPQHCTVKLVAAVVCGPINVVLTHVILANVPAFLIKIFEEEVSRGVREVSELKTKKKNKKTSQFDFDNIDQSLDGNRLRS